MREPALRRVKPVQWYCGRVGDNEANSMYPTSGGLEWPKKYGRTGLAILDDHREKKLVREMGHRASMTRCPIPIVLPEPLRSPRAMGTTSCPAGAPPVGLASVTPRRGSRETDDARPGVS